MTEKRTAIYSIKQDKVYSIAEPEFLKTFDYPSKKLEELGGKPPLHLSFSTDSSLDTARVWAYAFIAGSEIGPGVVLEYLYHLYLTINENLSTPWTSYKIVIGEKDVGPLDLLNIKISKDVKPAPTIDNPMTLTAEDDLYMLIIIMGLYRYSKCHPRQQPSISTKIESLAGQFRSSSKLIINVDMCGKSGLLLSDNNEFEMLASALDMFLNKFPNHKFARARIGTIVFRYSGCSAFADLSFLAKTIGAEQTYSVVWWFFSDSLDKEVTRMLLTSEEETGARNSYFPYMMGFKLCDSCPYSASNNPSVHLITHIVGSLFAIPRSINAIMIDHSAPVTLSVNAAIIFCAQKGLTNLEQRFASPEAAQAIRERERDRARLEAEQGDLDLGSIDLQSQLKDPDDWLIYYKSRNWVFGYMEYQNIKRAVESIPATREGSIGEWVKNQFLLQLKHEQV